MPERIVRKKVLKLQLIIASIIILFCEKLIPQIPMPDHIIVKMSSINLKVIMKSNFTKYLILILIALFFASTNEIDAKEAEQNYKTECHSFIESINYNLTFPKKRRENNSSKYISFLPLDNFQECLSLNLSLTSYTKHIKFIPQFFSKDIYIDISVLRI